MTIRLTYNSTNIDLVKIGPKALKLRHAQDRDVKFSGSGKNQTTNRYGAFHGYFDARFQDAAYDALWGWWSWARQGKEWAFAMDSGNVLNTTLNGAAAAAQADVTVDSVSTLAVGDKILIRAEDEDNEFERKEVQSISSLTITMTTNLVHSYSDEDTLRHFEYFPAVITIDDEFEPEQDGDWWSWTFHFMESL